MSEHGTTRAPDMDLEEQEAIDRVMEAVRRLADGVSDHFNDVLTVTSSSGELLADALSGRHPELGADLDNIQDAARRGWVLLGRLQAITSGQNLRRDRIDVGTQVLRLQDTLERLLPETIELRLQIEEGVHEIHGDVSALQRILLELATNARDAMPDGGILSVRVEEPGGDAPGGAGGSRVGLIVEDHGTGMDSSIRERAFDPFFTTKEEDGRAGLGLTIVFNLVRKQSGFVSVHSEPGAGTRVHITFPAAQTGAEVASGEGRSTEGGKDHGLHEGSPSEASMRMEPETGMGPESILVVEDDMAVRQLTHRVLERAGLKVVSVSDAEGALEFLTRSVYDVGLILSDLGLPGMDGVELLQQARTVGYVGPFILMSGHRPSDSDQHPLSIDSGATFLAKPWTISSLQSTVKAALRSSVQVLAG